MINIILCGGSGTRLWPISRTLMPKQFVKLFSHKSLFQLTVERNSKLCKSSFIVSNSEQYFLALDQLEELNIENNRYLLEPIGRNTAPAIALACMALDYDEIVLVTPSDHLIKDEKEYEKVINRAKEFASKNKLVTFGITPTFAETGFGYIQAKPENDECTILNVELFHEKPSFEIAMHYLEENSKLSIQNLPLKYLWNSGMFCFKAGIFLEELKNYSPEIYEASKIAFENANNTNNLIRIKHEDMANIPEDSIDYAVIEKSNIVKVIPSNISWSDVGSFDSLYEELPKDENSNTINDNHISIDSKNNLVYGVERKIATVDIEDLIIIDTGDALLISKKGSSQKVKKVVEKLKESNSQLHNIHLTGYRPWGSYTVLEESTGYKIKKIEVNPGKRLSLQTHKYRNEHWVVVSGIATVEVNNNTFLLNENESTYIKAGQIHRLSNNTDAPLVIIEVQVGIYTGEDDIKRFEDDFKREKIYEKQ
ncbi:mannose-1-phosphate guanylyltransferase/mannose-6-phosphate isomerase [Aliarcobacter cryaerophilus]|uniref:mannose-1-phosphate guanylyltransferase n=2 Tax=unclassified Arcobacter TaxID=2593671 RepID=A0AA96HZB5_9BACT|nr:mannose-1-phosphate guanylyltransferase/mannose-6-phosphate isomerase [Arcobacter sp. AZ-2023]WPD09101.1 mannose-1-phosphate guanylyltransferase/mannose-6-phosphate isomerase [Arcobacter sp. DSM 115954]WNL13932.1 mannose-1-phosphate guanylyltransferase/mannose-6-phosphate isomerase [Arcobacter sp. AZ-2023]WNL20187.1 mannose-1-phosphate guanylyltransferase/mannose-6-phosphate isomerase [Arcobacter sp. AZ-2023]WNL22329.1 mannose-1-phosphate guanylyltransferase/mannose-6-phosphate isomerase [Ar